MGLRHCFALCLIAFAASPVLISGAFAQAQSEPAAAAAAQIPAGQPASVRAAAAQSPAIITDLSRHARRVDDFLRLIYVPHSVAVTTLAAPGTARAFFGDTKFYQPPIPVSLIVAYAGGLTNPANDLVAMRCRPSAGNFSAIDPKLATWANVAKFLRADLPPADCPASRNASTAAKAYCLAEDFRDTPNQPLIASLDNAVAFGDAVFALPADSTSQTGAGLLRSLYGVGTGFSGLGFVVKDSANVSFNARETFGHSVVPEYLLKNVSLAQASCRCVQIPSYPGRDDELLSPRFVSLYGQLDGNGACRRVSQIVPF